MPPPLYTHHEGRIRARHSGVLATGPAWPSPRASDPLGSIDALPRPSSCGDVTFEADLVKPRAKRPRDTAEHPNSVASAFFALVFPATPWPRLDLLGVESRGDPACPKVSKTIPNIVVTRVLFLQGRVKPSNSGNWMNWPMVPSCHHPNYHYQIDLSFFEPRTGVVDSVLPCFGVHG